MKKAKIPLLILAMLLFVFNYNICEYFYFSDLKGWWFLKCDMLRASAVLTCFSFVIGSKGMLKAMLEVFIGFITMSIMDSSPTTIDFGDIIIIILTVLFAAYDYLKNVKNAN